MGSYPFCRDTPHRPVQLGAKAPHRTRRNRPKATSLQTLCGAPPSPPNPHESSSLPVLPSIPTPGQNPAAPRGQRHHTEREGFEALLGKGHLTESWRQGGCRSRHHVKASNGFPKREPLRRSLLDLMAFTRRGRSVSFFPKEKCFPIEIMVAHS